MNKPTFYRSYGSWFWRLRAGNNKVIADGSEGYENRADAVAGARLTANSLHAWTCLLDAEAAVARANALTNP